MTGLESFEQISKYDFQNKSLRTSAILDSSKLLFDVENQFGSDYLGTLSCLRYETVKKYTLLVHINPGNTSSTVSASASRRRSGDEPSLPNALASVSSFPLRCLSSQVTAGMFFCWPAVGSAHVSCDYSLGQPLPTLL